jgi:16S rRNA (guanine966-N2)-methyltransferase
MVASNISGARFLELFAGSGIFSLEAVSRGAEIAIAVDVSARATRALGTIVKDWEVPVLTLVSDAVASIESLASSDPFDIVYADPPYAFDRYPDLVQEIDASLPLSDAAVVAIEHVRGPAPFPTSGLERLELRKTVAYSAVSITLFDRR